MNVSCHIETTCVRKIEHQDLHLAARADLFSNSMLHLCYKFNSNLIRNVLSIYMSLQIAARAHLFFSCFIYLYFIFSVHAMCRLQKNIVRVQITARAFLIFCQWFINLFSVLPLTDSIAKMRLPPWIHQSWGAQYTHGPE